MSSTVNTSPSGVRRAASMFNILTRSTVILGVGLVTAQNILPVGKKPSDLIGGTLGAIEAATIERHTEASAELAGRTTDAQGRSQSKTIVLTDGMEVQTTGAKVADFACLLGMVMGGPVSNPDPNDSHAKVANGLSMGCVIGQKIRQNQVDTLDHAGIEPAS